MAKPSSEEIMQQWKQTILEQRESTFSIASWCRQKRIAAHKFYYWQGRLFPKHPLNHSAFIEAFDVEKSAAGIVLEYHGFNIHLKEHFDPSILKKCLEVLKKC